MREILFRGKRKDNGEWVEGGIIPLDAESGYVFIVEPYLSASTLPVYDIIKRHAHLVDPETVGQYTGLTDKNGKKIFEGDIIKTKHGIRYIVFVDGCFGAAKPNTCLFAELRQYNRELKGKWEVIGNIHDNSELLKGGDPE